MAGNNNIDSKLTKTNRRSQSNLMIPQPVVKNVTIVTKNDSLSLRGLIIWVKKTLEIDELIFDDMRTGAIYCQLLHALFPKAILLTKVRFATNVLSEYEVNFRILSAAFNKLGITRDIPVEHLIKGPANYEFCNWFHSFFLANWNGKPYKAKEMRQNAPIGMIRGPKELKRSNSIAGFELPRGSEDKPNSSRFRRNSSLTRIAPRTKPIVPKIIPAEVDDFCNESKSIELPPDSSSSDDETPKVVAIRESKIPVAIKPSPVVIPIQAVEAPISAPVPVAAPAPVPVAAPAPVPLAASAPVPVAASAPIPSPAPVPAAADPVPVGSNSSLYRFNQREREIQRLRKLVQEANEKLNSIRGILLLHFHDPPNCLQLIRQVAFVDLPLGFDRRD